MSLGRRAELQALRLIMTKARILRAGHSRQKSLNRVGEIFTEVSNGRGPRCPSQLAKEVSCG